MICRLQLAQGAAMYSALVVGFTVVIASDKFAYLPSVGVLMVLAALLVWLWDRPTRSRAPAL